MKQPNHSILRMDLNTLAGAVGRLEAQMMGFHLSGNSAEEVRALAERLVNLTLPSKGHLADGKAEEMRDAA